MGVNRVRNSNRIDMLNGPLFGKILMFALPLGASSVLQQLFNAADSAIVGRFAGNQALAGVGANGPVISLIINLFVGLSIGANVVIGMYTGRGDDKKISSAVHTTILVSVICGIFVGIIGMIIAEPILTMMGTPDDVMDLAKLYLRIYFAGMPFFMLYNFGSAVLRSVGDTRRPLYILIFSGIINVGLNLFLVVCFNMSVAGVGIATVTANAISAGITVFLLIREDYPVKLDLRKLAVDRTDLKMIARIGIPAGLQGMVFSFSNVCIQSAVNSFGSDVVAGSVAGMNFEYFTWFVVNAFGQAAVTFTSQNYGAGKYDRCKRVYKLTMVMAVVSCGTLGAVFIAGDTFFAGLFTTEAIAIQYAVIRMHWTAMIEFMTSSYEVTGGVLRGTGHSMLPAILTIFGTCALRVVWVFLVFPRFHSFPILMMVYPITWTVTGSSMIASYFILRKKIFRPRESSLLAED